MTVEELKQKKVEMEKAVSQIVSTFMADTGVVVHGFEIKVAQMAKGLPPSIVHRLPFIIKAQVDL